MSYYQVVYGIEWEIDINEIMSMIDIGDECRIADILDLSPQYVAKWSIKKRTQKLMEYFEQEGNKEDFLGLPFDADIDDLSKQGDEEILKYLSEKYGHKALTYEFQAPRDRL